jgi:hypothetical protein
LEPPSQEPKTDEEVGEEIAEKEKIVKQADDEWPELPEPKNATNAEKSKWRMSNQKENNKLLRETRDKTKAHKNTLVRLNHSKNLNDSKKLPQDIGRLVIDPKTGEPYPEAQLAGLVNKETQSFVKTINDFMIDAKTYFGARVTNFDVQAFKSRLPTLLNTESGRRLIIEQMKIMEELQLLHDQGLEDGLKHYGMNASYSDIQKTVDDRTTGREKELIDKMNNVLEASDKMDIMQNNPKFKGYVLMQNKDGKFKAVKQSDIEKAKKEKYKEW